MNTYLNDNLITVYTDNQISKYICYNFALGSKSVMRHVDELTLFLLNGVMDIIIITNISVDQFKK